MSTWEIVLIVIGVVLVIALIQMVIFKDAITRRQENIKKLTSEIRIAKAKYIQSLRKMNEKYRDTAEATDNLKDALKTNNGSYMSVFGGIRAKGYALDANDMHKFDNNTVDQLASGLHNSQLALNNAIREYNVYISRVFRLPYSKLFRCKKLEYIDQDNFDRASQLEDIDGYGV